METGKMQFAPDYESEKRDVTVALTGVEARAIAGDVIAMSTYDPVGLLSEKTSTDIRVEHARLRDVVVEAAKADRLSETAKTGTNADFDDMVKARRTLRAAVAALIAFESEHGIK